MPVQNLNSSNDPCVVLPVEQWRPSADSAMQATAIAALERGKVLILPHLAFALMLQEVSYLRPDCVKSGTKSVKYSHARDHIWGIAENENPAALKALMKRYCESSCDLLRSLFPGYASAFVAGNTSFRPVKAEGRTQSRRQDDRLLHVDAFPSRPVGGARILRVFTNIGQEVRSWRTGEAFADVAARMLPRIPPPLPGSATLLRFARLTKGTRTPYDHYMLKLHDAMKLDAAYQAEVPQSQVDFAPGSSWIVFSDQVSHAAVSGQHALEQTFSLPVEALAEPMLSPLRVLEQLTHRSLR